MPTPTDDQMWQQIQGLLGRMAKLETYVGTPTVSLATFEAYFTGLTGWTSYTPTLTQSATVTKTVTYAKYFQAGKTVIVNVNLAVTGSGTASNAILVGLPIAAAGSSNVAVAGSGFCFDTSATILYQGQLALVSSTTAKFLGGIQVGNQYSIGDQIFTAGLANTDQVAYFASYEAA